MDVRLSAEGDNSEAALRDLYGWLAQEPGLRGRIQLVEHEAEPGALGPVADAIQVALGSVGVLATALVAWLHIRRSEITVKLSRGKDESSVEVTAKGVRGLDLTATRALAEELLESLQRAELEGAEES
ncbi:hypothetical protein ABZU32_28895 [Sphaerisporangium sp. NPDC005288]|uniref:effector-associated constant component EACC1 n=1 Tax=Sphaerisporangium sp. NPDC005288 TaxID=3155114 RepID=UPI0033BA945A